MTTANKLADKTGCPIFTQFYHAKVGIGPERSRTERPLSLHPATNPGAPCLDSETSVSATTQIPPDYHNSGCPIFTTASSSLRWASCEARPLSRHPTTNPGAPCLDSETWVFEAVQSSITPRQRQRRALYQPGATPQVTPSPNSRGLKARPILADQQVAA